MAGIFEDYIQTIAARQNPQLANQIYREKQAQQALLQAAEMAKQRQQQAPQIFDPLMQSEQDPRANAMINAARQLFGSNDPNAADTAYKMIQQFQTSRMPDINRPANVQALDMAGVPRNDPRYQEAILGNVGGRNALDVEKFAYQKQKDIQDFERQKEIEMLKMNISMSKEDAKTKAIANKPLPAQALKLQQEALDIIGVASNSAADLGRIKEQIDNNEIDLGPVSNIINKGLNYAGLSTDESRKYQSFISTLEKLRNDSLRLNKGVQTEGDAVRAWNEILSNINDKKLVSDRLAEVKAINERAANIQAMNIDNIRANYGKEPLDISSYKKQPSALGQSNKSDDPLYKEYLQYLKEK